MDEVKKIGVIVRDQTPRILDESTPAGESWDFVFFREPAVFEAPFVPQSDFLALFTPWEESSARRDHLSRLFPMAEVFGYREGGPATGDGPICRDGAIPIVDFPMSPNFAQFLFHSLADLHSERQQQVLMRSRGDDLRMFLDSFVNMVDASTSVADRKPVMNQLLDWILARLSAEECLIYLCSEAGVTLQRAFGTGNIRDLDLFEHQANSNIVDRVITSGASHVDNNFNFEIKPPFGAEAALVRSVLCLPMIHRNQKFGVLEVLNKTGEGFTQADLNLAEMLVKPLAVAVSAFRRFDNAERLTNTDDLTRLYNYRYLMQYLEAEVKRCLRYKKKVSLLFIDVDGFKRVNDTYGHLVGSLALSEIGQVLRKILRETDVVGRYGGDEFVVVLPETPLNGALVIAERIRKKIEDYEFIAKDLSIHLTVSVGVANCPKHTLVAEGLIKKADAAMYRAKELSKNSIKVAV